MHWAIWVVAAIVVSLVVLLILWQVGVIGSSSSSDSFASPSATERSDDGAALPTSAPLKIDVPPLVSRGDQDLINFWLTVHPEVGDKTSQKALLHSDLVMVNLGKQVLHADPFGDKGGYCIHSAQGVTAVGHPDAQKVTLYIGSVKGQVIHLVDEEFGQNISLSHDAIHLCIQSKDSLYMYQFDKTEYTLSFTLPMTKERRVLCVTPDQVIWVTEPRSGRLVLYEYRDNQLEEHTSIEDIMAMDVDYMDESDHVWLACQKGLQHWSNVQGRWYLNNTWLEEQAFTTVHQFNGMLALGQAHKGTMVLCSALNPSSVIDSTKMESAIPLFSDSILWWEAKKLLVVSAPMYNVQYREQSGLVMFYKIQNNTLIPESMLTSGVANTQLGSMVELCGKDLIISRGNAPLIVH